MIENILQSMKIHHAMSDMQEREKAAQSWNIKIWRKSNLAIFHLKPELTKTHLDWYWQLVQIQRETQQNWNKGPFSEFCLCLHKILYHWITAWAAVIKNSQLENQVLTKCVESCQACGTVSSRIGVEVDKKTHFGGC